VQLERVIHTVDAHAEGEQSRVVVGGVLPPPGATVLEQMRHLQGDDALRRLLLYEPRGSAPLSANLVVPSRHPEADAGFVIMESSSYEGMSGSNAMCTAAVLVETGMLPAGPLVLEAPAGLVPVEVGPALEGGGRQVTLRNVASFALALDVPVSVPGLGELAVDVAYGGAFCAFVDAGALGFAVVPGEARALAELGERVREALRSQVEVRHPTRPALAHLSFVVLHAPPRAGGDARNATVVAPGRLDRCPTGTATSARLALLVARGVLDLGEPWVNESVLSTRFEARAVQRTRIGDLDAIVPEVSGRVFLTGIHQLVRSPGDPLGDGLRLPDTWGPAAADEGLLNA